MPHLSNYVHLRLQLKGGGNLLLTEDEYLILEEAELALSYDFPVGRDDYEFRGCRDRKLVLWSKHWPR